MQTFSHHISPLDQFEIRNLLSVDAPILANLSLSLTNIGLYLTIGGYFLFILNLMSTNNNKIVSNT
jgi:F-type H+-transporting ATPase subunit a